MKKHLLIPFLAIAFLVAGNAKAQDNGDYHCYRAWRKDNKIKKKEWQAENMEHYRPWAAERKMRAAYRKAWRRDMLEHEHRTGYYDHDWWSRGFGRDYWY